MNGDSVQQGGTEKTGVESQAFRAYARAAPCLPIRVGILGGGMIGRLRARAISHVAELRLVAVADARPELARELARFGRDVTVLADGLELALLPNVDAVILATPPASHESLGLACLKGGKHILIEKPMASSVESCDRLVRAAEQAGLTIATGFNLRYTRAALLARQLLDSGEIGDLDHVRAFHGYPGTEKASPPWLHDRTVSGGGALMDNGIHAIDLTRWFLGDIKQSDGYATNHVWGKPGCEDNGFLLLKSSKGRVATVQASWSEWRGYGYRVELYGTKGYIRFGYPPLYLIHGQRGASGKVRRRRYFFPFYQIIERIRGWEWGLVETLTRDLQGWSQALAAGSPVPISGHDGREAVRIAQSAQWCKSTLLTESQSCPK